MSMVMPVHSRTPVCARTVSLCVHAHAAMQHSFLLLLCHSETDCRSKLNMGGVPVVCRIPTLSRMEHRCSEVVNCTDTSIHKDTNAKSNPTFTLTTSTSNSPHFARWAFDSSSGTVILKTKSAIWAVCIK